MNVLTATEPFYVIETPTPRVWIDPDLELFYHRARKFLAGGAQPRELSAWLDLEKRLVILNLGYLQGLGFVRLMNDQETEVIQERRLDDEIFDKDTQSLTLAQTLPSAGLLIASYVYYFCFWYH
jgi:hypothetical protein